MTDPQSVSGLSLQDPVVLHYGKAMHGETWVLIGRTQKEIEEETKTDDKSRKD